MLRQSNGDPEAEGSKNETRLDETRVDETRVDETRVDETCGRHSKVERKDRMGGDDVMM